MAESDDDISDAIDVASVAEPSLPTDDKRNPKRQRQDATGAVSMEKPGPAQSVEGFTMWRFTGPYLELCVEAKGDGGKIIRHCRLCGDPIKPPKNGGWSNFKRHLYLLHKVSMISHTTYPSISVLLLQPFMHKDDFAHYEKKAAERKLVKQ